MKTLPGGLQAHLDSGATTLCHCWRLSLSDGRIFGFTDHDRPLVFDSVSYEPASGFTATTIETSLGLNVDNLDVLGALQSDKLTEADLIAGRIDNADIEIWRVNWADVSERVLLRKGNIGEITRGPEAFTAEVRGLAHSLNQPTGRLFQKNCDVDLGSAKCGVNLGSPSYSTSGTISSVVSRREFSADDVSGFAADFFTNGKISWLTGANQGLAVEVKFHGTGPAGHTFELWHAQTADIALGDNFTVTAGCDKSLAACKAKFNNVNNFRGFPHMPGNDFAISYPNRGEGNDGGSLTGN